MATQYAYSIHQKRHELLSQLVTKLLHVEPDDENYSLALDFCLQKAYYHSFLDINPRETESLYADMVARLEADSQLTKSAALTALTSKLLAVKLHSSADVQDLNHNLLHLLVSLSNQPLSSSLELTPDVLDLLYQPASTAHTQPLQEQPQQPKDRQTQPAGAGHFQQLVRRAAGRAAQHSDADSGDSCDEYDPYGDTSSLSDWGDSEGQKQQQQQQQLQQAAESSSDTEQQIEQHAVQAEQEAQPATNTQGVDTGGLPAALASKLAMTQLQHGCVVPKVSQPLAKLTALRPQRLVALSPLKQQLCLSERFLAQQVLRVLQGLPGEGFVIKHNRDAAAPPSSLQGGPPLGSASSTPDKASGTSGCMSWSSEQCIEVHPGVSTPHCLPGSLHALLADAAAAGTCARQLRALTQQLVFADRVGSRQQVTPCLRALGVALQQQLDWLGLRLADLQQQLQQDTKHSSSSSSSSSSSTSQRQDHGRGTALQVLMHEARPVLRRLHLLHKTVFGLLQQVDGPPAEVSARLIDGLTAAVRDASTAAATGPQGVANAAALLHLLLSSAVPLSRALAQWLWCAADGITEVSSTQQVPRDSSRGAQQNQQQQQVGASVCSQDFFILRTASSDMSAVHPSFWHAAYSFSQQEADAAAATADAKQTVAAAAAAGAKHAEAAAHVCCPAVLAPFAHSIMTAGKSMRLLDHMNQEDLKHSNLHSVDSATTSKQQAAAGAASDSAAAAAGQHPLQQAAAAAAAASTLQRRPSAPRQRRPSSAGGRMGSGRSAAGAAGRLSRQPSLSGFSPNQPAADSCAAAGTRPGTADRQVGSRKKWAASPALPGLAGAAALPAAGGLAAGRVVPRCVQLQLAAAAAVAGKQAQEELPAEFISTACYVLQQEQRLQVQAQGQLQQHQQYLQDCCGGLPGTAAGTTAATPPMLVQRLEAVASALAQPVDLQAAPTARHDPGQQGRQAAPSGQVSLRGALAAARKARMSSAALLDGEQQHTERPQPISGEGGSAAVGVPLVEADVAPVEASVLHADPACSPAAAAEPGADTKPACAPSAAAADAVASPSEPDSLSSGVAAAAAAAQAGMSAAETATAHDVLACLPAAAAAEDGGTDVQAVTAEVAAGAGVFVGSPDVVPRLTAWRDQMQERLTAAGQQLQQMAPWQPQQRSSSSTAVTASDCAQPRDSSGSHWPDSSTSKPSSKAGSRSWLLQSADMQAPSHFTGSLAQLWPLQPILGLREAAAGGSSSGSWLRDAAWPGSELAWLLQDPPQHLPDVQQLLSSALVQPVMARVELVDRQLMSSLMGEWGMLQQLQGLANTFIIASPAMVEWVDALFTAVECTRPPRDSSRPGGVSTPTSASKTLPRTSAMSGGLYSGSPGLVGSPRGGAGAASAAIASGMAVHVEHLEVTSLAALLQDCISSADPDDVLPDPDSLILSVNREELQKLHNLQQQQQKQQQQNQQQPNNAQKQGVAPMPTCLMYCSKEWVGLELHHAGSWQLSLVYTDQQLRFFSQVWRQMLQLRWARRRVGAQVTAHKSSAHINDHAARDLAEADAAAAVIAAKQRSRQGARSFGQGQGQAGSVEAEVMELLTWLSGKQELLLLQEMWHFLSCWHSYVMDGMRVKAWERLEKVLVSAKSLDQVHSGTRTFFDVLCSFCNLVPPGCTSIKYNMRSSMRHKLERLMDHALAAAAAAEREHAARQKLAQLQATSRSEADMQAWWVELAEARSALRQAGSRWHNGLKGDKGLLDLWATLKRSKMGHAFVAFQEVLDMNGFFSRLRAEASKAAGTQAAPQQWAPR